MDLPSRFLMAPLTRCRADPNTWIPNDLIKDYYTQRAGAALIISEFTGVKEKAIAFNTECCIYNDEQAAGWKEVTDSVHAAGGRIFCQIAHGGRACHPLNNDGELPVSASPIAIEGHTILADFGPTGEKLDHVTPRELTDEEVEGIVQDFAAAAKRAVFDAGFDGVEVHAANGYLVDCFLCASSNKRDYGKYAGTSLETRSQFLTEILEAVVKEIGANRVGVRISPLNSYQEMNRGGIENAQEEVKYIANICNGLGLAYLHLMRGDFFGMQTGDVVTVARETLTNPALIVNMGFQAEEAEEGIKAGKFDAVAFGTNFLTNPDYPEKIRTGAELNTPRAELYYTKKAEGYTDYPFMVEVKSS